MGVPKVLSILLENASHKVDLRAFADGQRKLRVAVDVSTWIHKACKGYSDMLGDEKHLSNYGRASLFYQHQQRQEGEEEGTPSTEPNSTAEAEKMMEAAKEREKAAVVEEYIAKCCKYVVDRLLTLQKTGNCELLVVLDGTAPPIKSQEVQSRTRKRQAEQEERDRPTETWYSTNDVEAAVERRIQAFKRTGAGGHYQTILSQLLTSLRENDLAFLVAPYEADGQLAFLSKCIDLIVTEDSDLLCYGTECPLLYKLSDNLTDGVPAGKMIRWADLGALAPLQTAESLPILDFSPALMAVLFVATGSDYCRKLRGIGCTGAAREIREAFFGRRVRAQPARSGGVGSPLGRFLDRILKTTWDRSDMSDEEREDYRKDFCEGLLMFRHPVVYDPVTRRCRTVNDRPDPELVSYEPYAALYNDQQRRSQIVGELLPPSVCTYVAEGWLNPRTKRPRDHMKIPDHVLKDLGDNERDGDAERESLEMETQDEMEMQEATEVSRDAHYPAADKDAQGAGWSRKTGAERNEEGGSSPSRRKRKSAPDILDFSQRNLRGDGGLDILLSGGDDDNNEEAEEESDVPETQDPVSAYI
jgi:5'-3' exonuclease